MQRLDSKQFKPFEKFRKIGKRQNISKKSKKFEIYLKILEFKNFLKIQKF